MAVSKVYHVTDKTERIEISLAPSAPSYIRLKQSENVVFLHKEALQDLIDALRELQGDL